MNYHPGVGIPVNDKNCKRRRGGLGEQDDDDDEYYDLSKSERRNG